MRIALEKQNGLSELSFIIEMNIEGKEKKLMGTLYGKESGLYLLFIFSLLISQPMNNRCHQYMTLHHQVLRYLLFVR